MRRSRFHAVHNEMGEIVLEILGLIAYGTGELILYAVTLRGYKPKWPYEMKDSGFARELSVNLSTCVGVIFWSALLVLIAWLVAR